MPTLTGAKTPIFLRRGQVVQMKPHIFLRSERVVVATEVGRGKNPRKGASSPDKIPHISAEWDSSTAEQVKVFQIWKDAEVVTLFKGKGARTDPSNYRGIFFLDVAGKVLATVIERRLKRAAECWLDDSQNGFREKRSTSMSIHVLCRIQEACRSADLKAFAVFVDFKKAFDYPPRKALYDACHG
jgi:hypothetical protein